MNKIFLIGNICKDIELRMTASEKKVVSNSIAVRNDYKNAEGEYDSEFFNFTAWESKAEYLSKYAQKGSQILIEGRMTNQEYEDEETGQKKRIAKVIAEKIQILNSRKDKAEAPAEATEESDPFAEDINDITVIDDSELPF